MSEQRSPDYVDRCIDYISNLPQRCFADAALGALIIGALLAFSPNEYSTGTEHRASKNGHDKILAIRDSPQGDREGPKRCPLIMV